MRNIFLAIPLAIFFLVGISSCGSYYMVTDPSSGNVYYTTNFKDEGGGAIEFIDDRNDNIVTLQSSELKEISEEEFNRALKAAQ